MSCRCCSRRSPVCKTHDRTGESSTGKPSAGFGERAWKRNRGSRIEARSESDGTATVPYGCCASLRLNRTVHRHRRVSAKVDAYHLYLPSARLPPNPLRQWPLISPGSNSGAFIVLAAPTGGARFTLLPDGSPPRSLSAKMLTLASVPAVYQVFRHPAKRASPGSAAARCPGW